MTLKFVELVSYLTISRLHQVRIADFSKGVSCSKNNDVSFRWNDTNLSTGLEIEMASHA